MRLSRIFYITFLTLLTTSCSSWYDSWQGYEAIEPAGDEFSYQNPRNTQGELDKVVESSQVESMAIISGVNSNRDEEAWVESEIKGDELSVIAEAEEVGTAGREELDEDILLISDIDGLEDISVDDEDLSVAEVEREVDTDVNIDTTTDTIEKSQEEREASVTYLVSEIKYNKDSDRLSDKDKGILSEVTKGYQMTPSKVEVIGYAINKDKDIDGENALYLLDLATRRAEKVALELIRQGIEQSDIKTSSKVIDIFETGSKPTKDITEIYFSY